MSEERKDEQGYNGWANYETWATALWIDNEQDTYLEARQIVRDNLSFYQEGDFGNAGEVKVYPVADALKTWAEDLFIEPVTVDSYGLASDLLGKAFGAVDWFEISRNWIDEVREDEDQEAAE